MYIDVFVNIYIYVYRYKWAKKFLCVATVQAAQMHFPLVGRGC